MSEDLQTRWLAALDHFEEATRRMARATDVVEQIRANGPTGPQLEEAERLLDEMGAEWLAAREELVKIRDLASPATRLN